MNVVAQRGTRYFLVDLGGGKGQVFDRQENVTSSPQNIHSILARGYWQRPAGSAATAVKYDPEQPRDEGGRWTSGGAAVRSAEKWRDPRELHPKEWRRIADRCHAQGAGNCYQAVGTLAMEADRLGLQHPKIIHATAVGQGPIKGREFGHAWIEADGPMGIRMAYDFSSGKETVLPASFYRQVGQVKDVHEYTVTEALGKMVRAGHFGPWDDES